ncbi:hypothetical protein CHLRE_12g559054v5 [Chlamydomonas reinhardtii]|uniref:Uncharacterized protein n=1 Tax=Chlamydomonas reinhardtii TaxID=3055 RepID=A0A2K3D5N2_CHLRE|nr:uncharacterized protein CHLRE_12g559054v5 [Chlamydomonas reinhardtii]PNW75827.1 hypothetical protein CHLRE_12g559054v5 [Chlamydomonas reinhardtii]
MPLPTPWASALLTFLLFTKLDHLSVLACGRALPMSFGARPTQTALSHLYTEWKSPAADNTCC